MAFNQGGFGGGGFMNNATPSSQQSPEGRKGDRPTTLIPLPIIQLHNCNGSIDVGFEVYNHSLGQVCIVGIVRNIEIKSTKIQYKVEDSTGMIDVTKWADSDDDSEQAAADPNVRENTYVKVMGTLKDFNGQKSISAFHVSKLEDTNEITTHCLDSIYTYLRMTKGPLGGPMQNQQQQQQQQNMQPGQMNRAQAQQQNMPQNQYTMQNNNDMDTGGIGGNQIQEDVLRAIKMTDDESGMSVDAVMNQLRSNNYTETAIRDAIEWLSTEGHVYSTIDDDHFKSTDS